MAISLQKYLFMALVPLALSSCSGRKIGADQTSIFTLRLKEELFVQYGSGGLAEFDIVDHHHQLTSILPGCSDPILQIQAFNPVENFNSRTDDQVTFEFTPRCLACASDAKGVQVTGVVSGDAVRGQHSEVSLSANSPEHSFDLFGLRLDAGSQGTAKITITEKECEMIQHAGMFFSISR